MDEFLLNGKQRSLTEGATLGSLLAELELDPRWVVAELNGRPIERDRYSETSLTAGDRLELVRPVAGG
jgi:sulfur carrier protein